MSEIRALTQQNRVWHTYRPQFLSSYGATEGMWRNAEPN